MIPKDGNFELFHLKAKKKLIFFPKIPARDIFPNQQPTMSLSSILELCEQHMSEGDYLIAAETLKRVHEVSQRPSDAEDSEDEEEGTFPVFGVAQPVLGNPTVSSSSSTEDIRRVYMLPDDERPCLCDAEDSEGFFKFEVVGYAHISKRTRPDAIIRTQILYSMGVRRISYVEDDAFKFLVQTYMKFQNWTDVNFHNYFGRENEPQSFRNFLAFYKKKELDIRMETSSSDDDYLNDEEIEEINETIKDNGLMYYYNNVADKLHDYIIMLMDLKVGEQQSS